VRKPAEEMMSENTSSPSSAPFFTSGTMSLPSSATRKLDFLDEMPVR
jgi:hypothetical protein